MSRGGGLGMYEGDQEKKADEREKIDGHDADSDDKAIESLLRSVQKAKQLFPVRIKSFLQLSTHQHTQCPSGNALEQLLIL
mmetsp:Transcript_10281/g.38180  ORF Transcript_10281/g.38180 Transcript_10281/m.38180 type:complete len:81 (-) Transcript_10281:212-454(-)